MSWDVVAGATAGGPKVAAMEDRMQQYQTKQEDFKCGAMILNRCCARAPAGDHELRSVVCVQLMSQGVFAGAPAGDHPKVAAMKERMQQYQANAASL